VFYVYCNLGGQYVNSVWYESFNTKISYEYASGDVVNSLDDSSIHVSLPGLNANPTAVSTNIQIHGNEIFFNSGSGWAVYKNVNYTITTWSTVDCSDCGEGGELENNFVCN
jgi:hypothetical protein